jgi:serine/threonine protein kinase
MTGKLLGMGPYGSIYASTVESIPLTLRLIEARSRVAREHIRHEIDILKRISHNHVVQLVGSYTQRSEFGLLIYPRALCNLRTFLEQVENYCSRPSSDNTSNALLDQLNYSSAPNSQYRATPAYQRIGCILSAVAYLHESNIKRRMS